MGFVWDLIQQCQISSQQSKAATIEERVHQLEGQLRHTQMIVRTLLERLEKQLGEDIDRDGRIG